MFFVLDPAPKVYTGDRTSCTYSVYNQDYKATNFFLAAIDREYIKKPREDGGQLGSKTNSGQ